MSRLHVIRLGDTGRRRNHRTGGSGSAPAVAHAGLLLGDACHGGGGQPQPLLMCVSSGWVGCASGFSPSRCSCRSPSRGWVSWGWGSAPAVAHVRLLSSWWVRVRGSAPAVAHVRLLGVGGVCVGVQPQPLLTCASFSCVGADSAPAVAHRSLLVGFWRLLGAPARHDLVHRFSPSRCSLPPPFGALRRRSRQVRFHQSYGCVRVTPCRGERKKEEAYVGRRLPRTD
jgi:hypothetical protein